MESYSYQQPAKNLIREIVLPQAIRKLTVDRDDSCIVRHQELSVTVNLFLGYLKHLPHVKKISRGTRAELSEWIAYHKTEIGCRHPDSLKVLYLCGPEPLNDLDVMIREGINPHNVWAITSSSDDQAAAMDQCERAKIPLKIHQGSLKDFFDTFNLSFDIIYFDACGPFCGGKPNTLDPIVSMFERQRLNSPGALITNFCSPPDEGEARSRYVDIVTAYYAPRYRDVPAIIHQHGPDPQMSQHEPKFLRAFSASHLDEIYSEFISGFLTDLGMSVLPNCKALCTTSLFQRYLAKDKVYRQTVDKANKAPANFGELGGDIELSPSSYPLLSFFRLLGRMQKDDPILLRLSLPHEANRRSRFDLIEAASMMNAVIEGHWEGLSDVMCKAVLLSWFDYRLRLTCDLPLPNLTINSLLGIYGCPWFVNPRVSERFTYQAKTRRMYCDMLILDQCRSFYDWFPTVESCRMRFDSIPFQIVARSIMDRIGRHNFSNESHPFKGASVAGFGEDPVADWYDLPERRVISL